MDLQHNPATAPSMHLGTEGSVVHEQKSSLVSESVTGTEISSGCFDCNICLDSCHDPVVTLCGHLYCWPCIYKWFQVQNSSIEPDEQPKCPVCKYSISTSSLVPLYGRGRSSETKKAPVPNRPAALGMNALLNSNQQNNSNQSFHQHDYFSHSPITPSSPSFSPTISMVGEMVFAGMFGNSDMNLFDYPYQNSYYFPSNGSPRLRRHEMQLDKSLNRVSIFLFCCVVMCLILF